MEKIENKENLDFVYFKDIVREYELGQVQYISDFINPHPSARENGVPFFSDIRVEGSPDDCFSIKIHKDDVRKFIKKWFEFKKQQSPSFSNKKVEAFL